MILSRRVLYFLGDRVFYRCRAAEHGEHYLDLLPETEARALRPVSLLPKALLMAFPVFDYSVVLSYYTKRALTDQSDAIRAMTGIIRRFAEVMMCTFFEGIPVTAFDLFITFYGSQGTLRRRFMFPSYSWTGWRGNINANCDMTRFSGASGLNDWLRKNTWIVWFQRSPSGIVSPVLNLDATDSRRSEIPGWVGYQERSSFSDFGRSCQGLDTSEVMPTEHVSFSRAIPAYPILQFWTLSVFYGLTGIDVFRATGYLLDSNDTLCGFIRLDGLEETTFFDLQSPFEVILLSESRAECNRIQLGRVYPNSGKRILFYNVLLLEWQDGIAVRRGAGHILQNALDKSLPPGPVWKEIFLA